MARIEGEQHGDAGRVREWLARAAHAARDPAWTADGVVSDRWAPISPVTGVLDAFRWRVPAEASDTPAGALLSAKVKALAGLEGGGEPALTHAAAAPAGAPQTLERPTAPVAEARDPEAVRPPAPVAASAQSGPTASASEPTDPAPANGAAKEDDLGERIRVAAQRAIAASVAQVAAADTRTGDGAVGKKRQTPRQPNTIEPKIFVSPRPPDDPGLECEPQPHAAHAGPELEPSRSGGEKA
jgi:HemY protein